LNDFTSFCRFVPAAAGKNKAAAGRHPVIADGVGVFQSILLNFAIEFEFVSGADEDFLKIDKSYGRLIFIVARSKIEGYRFF
jgi:hypothetical protein